MLVFSVQLVFAQEYVFRVIASEGNNILVNGENQESKKLEAGDMLLSSGKLVTSNNCYLGLVHKSGQTMEIVEQGTYAVESLIEKFRGREGIAKWHLNARWDQVTAILSAIDDNPEIALGLNVLPGSVSSDKLVGVAVNPKKLNPVFNEEIEMRWQDGVGPLGSRYIVNVMDLYDRLLISEIVEEPKFTLNFSDERLMDVGSVSNRKIISFIVYCAEDQDLSSWRYGLTRINGPTAEQVAREVQFFKDALHPLTLLDQLVLATYFEEKGLLLDALTTYEHIVKEAPQVKDFNSLRNAFISRNLQKLRERTL